MVMIKPTLWYLDLVVRVKKMIDVPLVVQVVSGEYLMLRKGGENRREHPEADLTSRFNR